MNFAAVICVGVVVIAYAFFSNRLSRSVLTPPLVFVAFGFVVRPGGLSLAKIDVVHSAIHLIAEITLVLVLFTDAARIDLRRLIADHTLPQRMLLIGLPLTMALGALIAYGMFPTLGLMGALLLAAVLAPTDAALGAGSSVQPRTFTPLA